MFVMVLVSVGIELGDNTVDFGVEPDGFERYGGMVSVDVVLVSVGFRVGNNSVLVVAVPDLSEVGER